LRRTWDRREQVSFSLPIARQDIRIGSAVDFEGGRPEYLVTEIEEGLTRKIRARHIARIADAPALGGSMPNRTDDGGYAFGRPHVLFLDLPLSGNDGIPLNDFR